MLTALRSIGNGCEHLTSGFDAADALDVDAYREMMRNSLFVPCPAGFASLDSFRVYEALEAGCVPIVERRSGFDYFFEAYGNCPVLSVESWEEVPDLINEVRRDNGIDALIAGCTGWWKRYKANLTSRIRLEVNRAG